MAHMGQRVMLDLYGPIDAQLHEHGIHTENSDIRAHVSAANQSIYVFKTSNANAAINLHAPPIKPASQPGVKGRTAEGWVIKASLIEDIRVLKYSSYGNWRIFNNGMNTSEKGKFAVEVVISLMRIGRFPLWMEAYEDERENIQLKGTDILLFCRKKIQVKCDYPAGITGNLYLQRAERNPLRRT